MRHTENTKDRVFILPSKSSDEDNIVCTKCHAEFNRPEDVNEEVKLCPTCKHIPVKFDNE